MSVEPPAGLTGPVVPSTRVTQAYKLIWIAQTVNAQAAWERATRARRGMRRIGVVRR